MSQTLLTGASGLLSHQRKLDVVANNLANLNTVGYKAQRILFSDLIYSTIQRATSGTNENFGGTNPRQAGFGVSVAQTSRDHGQGVLSATGSSFDFGIQGSGFFVLDDGAEVYSRAGSFSLDSNGFLVDPGTGAFVQRHGSLGEGNDGFPQFQQPGVGAIHVPLGAGVAGRATSEAGFSGNLPATATGPLTEVVQTDEGFQTGAAAATATTLLNDIDSLLEDYVPGDEIIVSGTDPDGTEFTSTVAVDGTTTLGDIVDEINAQISDATAAIDADGNIVVTADEEGDAEIRIKLLDGDTNTGFSNFSKHSFSVETDGKEGDIVESTIQVFDIRGEAHEVAVEFQKLEANEWDATFRLINQEGEILDSTITQIEFTEDGRFRSVNGAGVGDPTISIQFDNLTDPQSIDVTLDSVTHLATSFSMSFEQDGFEPGSLVSVAVNQDGSLDGVATNGQRIPVAQLAIANFNNIQGLEAIGQNYYQQTANSGVPNIGAGLTGGTGVVRNGQLESSNVDVALEFTQLIVAQRGFSANARTITVANEVLEEMTNIVR